MPLNNIEIICGASEEQRVCGLCDDVEDELYFLPSCPSHDELRKSVSEKVQRKKRDSFWMSEFDRQS